MREDLAKANLITLSITLPGYYLTSEGIHIDRNVPQINHDIRYFTEVVEKCENITFQTYYGWISAELVRRHRDGQELPVIMSLDNTPPFINGQVVIKGLTDFLEIVCDYDEATKILDKLVVVATSVDRICVQPNDVSNLFLYNTFNSNPHAILTEPYNSITCSVNKGDTFPECLAPMLEHGLSQTENIVLVAEAKTRMVNGGHVAAAHIAQLLGSADLASFMNTPVGFNLITFFLEESALSITGANYINKFTENSSLESIFSHLHGVPAGTIDFNRITTRDFIEADTTYDNIYRILDRFGNSALSDKIPRLNNQGSSKLPSRVAVAAVDLILMGNEPIAHVIAHAGWLHGLLNAELNEKGDLMVVPENGGSVPLSDSNYELLHQVREQYKFNGENVHHLRYIPKLFCPDINDVHSSVLSALNTVDETVKRTLWDIARAHYIEKVIKQLIELQNNKGDSQAICDRLKELIQLPI
jgi:mannitol-1-phosphate/altronate dehydrogenase